jgi:bifunctional enzyme CysN/CysC/sulfate adenylyltransferase subunit 1
VSRIVTWDGNLTSAAYPQSITVELEDEIDLSRGEMLVSASAEQEKGLPAASRHLRAMVVWMHEEPLVVGRTYVAKHTTRTVRATVKAIRYRVDVTTLEHASARQLAMNEIAEVELETNLPLFFDAYAESRTTGSMILIDSLTNATVGAAMITGASQAMDDSADAVPAVVLLPGRPALAEQLREHLEAHGYRAAVIDDELIPDDALLAVVRALDLAGVTAISARSLAEDVVDALAHAVKGFSAREVLHADDLDDNKVLEIAGGAQ